MSEFLVKWHALTKSTSPDDAKLCTKRKQNRKYAVSSNVLFTPVQQENFYDGFYERLEQFERR